MDRRVLAKVGSVVLALAVASVGLALVAAGGDHQNPPVTQEPAWDSPRTRQLAVRACFDCHSNETVWPAYASVAPFSWMVQEHVDEGRAMLNFSEFDRPQEEVGEAAEVVANGEMPMWQYTAMHPTARLTAQETEDLVAGLRATLGAGDDDLRSADRRGHLEDEDD